MADPLDPDEEPARDAEFDLEAWSEYVDDDHDSTEEFDMDEL